MPDGTLDKAESIFQEICSKTDNPGYFYNYACILSRKENREKALSTLETCLKLDKGNMFRGFAKTDSTFDNIRELPTFQELIA